MNINDVPRETKGLLGLWLMASIVITISRKDDPAFSCDVISNSVTLKLLRSYPKQFGKLLDKGVGWQTLEQKPVGQARACLHVLN